MIGKVLKSKLFNILVIFTLILSSVMAALVPAENTAAQTYPYAPDSPEVSKALDYLRGQLTDEGEISSFGISAWAVMAIAAAGEDPHEWKTADDNPSIVDYLAANADKATITTDYERMILAIVAAGEDPTSFGGKDFVTLLEDDYRDNQIGDSSLLNDDFWGMMALVAAGEPATSEVIQKSKNFILSNQNDDGGWSYGVGGLSEVDDTAAAIMALITAGQPANSEPITKALNYIKSTQQDDGGFLSWGSTNSATDSWAIAAIVAAGQDPTSDEWKSEAGNSPVDHLLSLQDEDGGFKWQADIPSNKAWMTSYAIVALLGTSYPVVRQPTPTPTSAPLQEEAGGWLWWYSLLIALAALAVIALIALLVMRGSKRREG